MGLIAIPLEFRMTIGLDLQALIPKPKAGVKWDDILLVSQLPDSDHIAWDIHKLKQCFKDSTIESILNIPNT